MAGLSTLLVLLACRASFTSRPSLPSMTTTTTAAVVAAAAAAARQIKCSRRIPALHSIVMGKWTSAKMKCADAGNNQQKDGASDQMDTMENGISKKNRKTNSGFNWIPLSHGQPVNL